ncbi:MAG: zf-HC2 domain-containing protein, partial [Myxococcota bacterium]|nr:zf-HC2 domain-containing protein [Myxococcota bacterium]
MLGCREVDERLLPLLYGEVPGHEAEALRAHLRGCPGCAASYERLAAARGIARRTQWTEEPPAWLDEAVRRRVAELFGPPAVAASARPGVAARLWAWLTSLASGPQVAMATLMLLVVAIGIWQLPRDEVDSGAGRVLVNVDSSDGVVGTSGPTPAAPLELRVDPRSKRLLPAPAATLEPATAVGGPPPVAGAGSAGSPHKPPPARAGRGGASERHGAIPGSVAREETRVADVATPHERTAVAHPTERAAPGPTPLEPGAALEAPAT